MAIMNSSLAMENKSLFKMEKRNALRVEQYWLPGGHSQVHVLTNINLCRRGDFDGDQNFVSDVNVAEGFAAKSFNDCDAARDCSRFRYPNGFGSYPNSHLFTGCYLCVCLNQKLGVPHQLQSDTAGC